MTMGPNAYPDFSRGDGLPHGSSKNDQEWGGDQEWSGVCAYDPCHEPMTHHRATAYGRLVGYCGQHAALGALLFDGVDTVVNVEGGARVRYTAEDYRRDKANRERTGRGLA